MSVFVQHLGTSVYTQGFVSLGSATPAGEGAGLRALSGLCKVLEPSPSCEPISPGWKSGNRMQPAGTGCAAGLRGGGAARSQRGDSARWGGPERGAPTRIRLGAAVAGAGVLLPPLLLRSASPSVSPRRLRLPGGFRGGSQGFGEQLGLSGDLQRPEQGMRPQGGRAGALSPVTRLSQMLTDFSLHPAVPPYTIVYFPVRGRGL